MLYRIKGIMNWKLIALGIAIFLVIIFVSRETFTGRRQGFQNPNSNTFTMYYMNGCPHCESILPDFKKLVAAGQLTLNGKKTQFRMLEQGDPAAASELEARNVKGFPTFYLATANNNFIEYQGDRSASAIKDFIGQNAV